MVDSLVDKVGIRSCASWPRLEIGRATDVAIANDLQEGGEYTNKSTGQHGLMN